MRREGFWRARKKSLITRACAREGLRIRERKSLFLGWADPPGGEREPVISGSHMCQESPIPRRHTRCVDNAEFPVAQGRGTAVAGAVATLKRRREAPSRDDTLCGSGETSTSDGGETTGFPVVGRARARPAAGCK